MQSRASRDREKKFLRHYQRYRASFLAQGDGEAAAVENLPTGVTVGKDAVKHDEKEVSRDSVALSKVKCPSQALPLDQCADGGSSPAETFHRFPWLPNEIQYLIWKHARLPARVIKPLISKMGNTWFSPAPIPPILHVCQQSRFIALESYQLSLTLCYDIDKDFLELKGVQPRSGKGRIFFDAKRDFLYRPNHVAWSDIALERSTVQNLAWEYDDLPAPRSSSPYVWCPPQTWYTNTTRMMMLKGNDEFNEAGWAYVDEFVGSDETFAWQNGKSLLNRIQDMGKPLTKRQWKACREYLMVDSEWKPMIEEVAMVKYAGPKRIVCSCPFCLDS